MSNNGSNTLTRSLSVLGKLFVGSRKGPTGDRVRSLRKLQKRIGVRFTDLSLLEQALTHRSYSHVTAQTRNDSNERMEFLGDSVLGLSVSQFLYLEFPDRSEGALSKMKSLLVSRKVLSSVSRTIGLGEYLLLSGEESDMGGRDRTSILADSFEGLIGAIYLDQGYRSANLFIRRTLLSDINEILKDEEHTNYKSLLQEYVQSRRLSHPVYRVRREEGPEHEKEFAVDVIVRGEPWGSGRGKSKKDAEQNAARAALERRQERSSRSSRGAAVAPAAGGAAAAPESPRRRGRRGEGRDRGERAGRRTPPEVADAPPTRPRGDHGIAASRERIRTQRGERSSERTNEHGEERRRSGGEVRSRRVSDRPPRERIAREPREPKPPRERRGRESGETVQPAEAEEPARRRRRRRGSRGGTGRSPSEEVAGRGPAPEGGTETAPPAEETVGRAEPAEARPEAPREASPRAEREEHAEPPRIASEPESHEADHEAERPPRRREARPEPAATSFRGETGAEREPAEGSPESSERAAFSRSPRRAPRPEPAPRREPAAPPEPEPIERDTGEEPSASGSEDSGSELAAAGGGDAGFTRRRKRTVRGFRKR